MTCAAELKFFIHPIIFKITNTSRFEAFRGYLICTSQKTSPRNCYPWIRWNLVDIRPQSTAALQSSEPETLQHASEWPHTQASSLILLFLSSSFVMLHFWVATSMPQVSGITNFEMQIDSKHWEWHLADNKEMSTSVL